MDQGAVAVSPFQPLLVVSMVSRDLVKKSACGLKFGTCVTALCSKRQRKVEGQVAFTSEVLFKPVGRTIVRKINLRQTFTPFKRNFSFLRETFAPFKRNVYSV